MVTLTSADNALKNVYLEVVANQLNTAVNPLLAKIQKTTSDVWGKNIVKLAPYGVNGGISATTEDGSLPMAGANNYVQFVSTLKNLYGKIEISDKAIRASKNSEGAFVNLLNDEMEGLIKASAFNFGRMIYGDGTGKLATISSITEQVIKLDKVNALIEGMVVDFYKATGEKITDMNGSRIVVVDRVNKTIKVSKTLASTVVATGFITVQNSYNNELTGLGAIFAQSGSLYGLSKDTYSWLKPTVNSSFGAITDSKLQEVLDGIEENHGSKIDFIACSYDARRKYQEYLETYKRNIDVMQLEGGFKAISFNGIPVVADRFVDEGTMYLLNTADFALHELCDWQWLEGEDGRILKQNAGFATYSATLVKYADLICNRPGAQAKITGITASSN